MWKFFAKLIGRGGRLLETWEYMRIRVFSWYLRELNLRTLISKKNIIHKRSNTFHYLVAKDSMKDNRNIKIYLLFASSEKEFASQWERDLTSHHFNDIPPFNILLIPNWITTLKAVKKSCPHANEIVQKPILVYRDSN